MKRFLMLTLVFAFFFVLSIGIKAETEINISGQVRVRDEMEKKDFNPADTYTQSFSLLRSRIGIEAIVDKNTHAFVQFQDSREFGDYTVWGVPASGSLNNGRNVDIHQAYIQIDNLFGKGWGGKAGRFELNLGNQRVFGAVGWSNVGRAWEGESFWYNNDKYNFSFHWLSKLELNNPSYDNDFDIFGVYSQFKELNLDLYGFYEYNADTNGLGQGINQLERASIGTYYKRKYQQFDFETNGVFQFGTLPRPGMMDSTLDITAFMFTFETGYSFEGNGNARIAGAIDYTSGDDDPTDDKYNTYNNLYYTGHKFRGYMDYFVGSNQSGLMDLILRGKIDPINGWIIKGDFHYFTTAKDYADPINSGTTKDVGAEIDLTVKTSRVKGVTLQGGVSLFLPSESFAGMKDPDPGFWFYDMATVNF